MTGPTWGSGALALGTAPLGSRRDGPLWWGPQSTDDAVATVRRAIEVDVAAIDTAPFYGWGRAEEIVAASITDLGRRPPVLSKCGVVREPDGTSRRDASPDAIRRDVEASLERLGVDRIDVVQVHNPDPRTPIEDTWTALEELRVEGVIGGAGLSNHPPGAMDRAMRIAPVEVVQHQWSLLHREVEHDGVLAWCATHDVPLLAWAPLASGFLTDGFDLGTLDPDDLRHRLPWATSPRTGVVRARLAEIAEDRAVTGTTVALAWVARRTGVIPLVGARTPTEAAALAAPLPALDDADLRSLDEASSA